jgi:hypothetical protein
MPSKTPSQVYGLQQILDVQTGTLCSLQFEKSTPQPKPVSSFADQRDWEANCILNAICTLSPDSILYGVRRIFRGLYRILFRFQLLSSRSRISGGYIDASCGAVIPSFLGVELIRIYIPPHFFFYFMPDHDDLESIKCIIYPLLQVS